MPGNYDSLISQVAALGNPRTAMVMQADGPYDIQDAQKDFPAIVFSGYNGESQGTALAQVLFGGQNPSGHLDFTWFADDSQLPAMDNYGLTPSQTGGLGRTYMYSTGKPTYPFGYGLSYSHFTYSHVQVGPGSVSADGTVNVRFDVTNTGTAAGSTVAQLYAAPQFTVPGAELPKEQLAGFKKTAVLAPGHTQHVNLSVKVADLSQWDEGALKQVVHDGAYQFRVGPDSATVAGSGTVRVHGAITPRVQSVTVQPGQVVFNAGDSLDLTAANPWVAPDTDSTLEQKHAAADHIIEAADNDQSFADLSHAHVTYRTSDPRVATVSRRRGHHAGTRRREHRRDGERRDRHDSDRGAEPVQPAGGGHREAEHDGHRDRDIHQHQRAGGPSPVDGPDRAERLDGEGDLTGLAVRRRSGPEGDGHLERAGPGHREPGHQGGTGRDGGVHRRGRRLHRSRGQCADRDLGRHP